MSPPSILDPAAARLLVHAHCQDVMAFLRGMIEGTVPLEDASLFETLESWFTTYQGDAEVSALLERAANVYSDAAMEAAGRYFAHRVCDAVRHGTFEEFREDFEADDDSEDE